MEKARQDTTLVDTIGNIISYLLSYIPWPNTLHSYHYDDPIRVQLISGYTEKHIVQQVAKSVQLQEHSDPEAYIYILPCTYHHSDLLFTQDGHFFAYADKFKQTHSKPIKNLIIIS